MELVFNLPVKKYLELKLLKELGRNIPYELKDEHQDGKFVYSEYEIVHFLNDNKIIPNKIIVTPTRTVDTVTKIFNNVRFSEDVKIAHDFEENKNYNYSIMGDIDDIVIDISDDEDIIGYEILEQTTYNLLKKCKNRKVGIIYDKINKLFVAIIDCDKIKILMR